MRVLSIDPGYDRIGFALVEKNAQGSDHVLYSDCFVTKRDALFEHRLLSAGNEMEQLITRFAPTVCAIEKLFFFSNQKTAMAVSEARGIFLYIAARHKLTVFEYTPLQVKSAVTGDGRSDKRQVTTMVQKLVQLPPQKRFDDEYDAIAIGLTCLATER